MRMAWMSMTMVLAGCMTPTPTEMTSRKPAYETQTALSPREALLCVQQRLAEVRHIQFRPPTQQLVETPRGLLRGHQVLRPLELVGDEVQDLLRVVGRHRIHYIGELIGGPTHAFWQLGGQGRRKIADVAVQPVGEFQGGLEIERDIAVQVLPNEGLRSDPEAGTESFLCFGTGLFVEFF